MFFAFDRVEDLFVLPLDVFVIHTLCARAVKVFVVSAGDGELGLYGRFGAVTLELDVFGPEFVE